MRRLALGLCLVGAFAILSAVWIAARAANARRAPSAPDSSARLSSESSRDDSEAHLDEASTPAAAPLAADARTPEVASNADDVGLLIHVVDPSGVGVAGVATELRHDGAPGLSISPAETDRDGDARFADGCNAVVKATSLHVRHDIPFEREIGSASTAEDLAHCTTTSALPWGGSIRLSVRNLDGTPAPDGSFVGLTLIPRGHEANPLASGRAWFGATRAAEALFPWVELGRTWDVAARSPGSSVPTTVRLVGPVEPREIVSAEIVLGSDHPVVSFRAIRADGSPLQSVALELARQSAGRASTSDRVITDSAGRFAVEVESAVLPPGDGNYFVVTCRPEPGRVQQAKAILPSTLEPGSNDGGDVVLDSPPLLCAGVVLDDVGGPVGRAGVRATTRWDARDRGFGGSAAELRTEVDGLGQFELRGYLPSSGSFYVWAQTHESRSEPRLTRAGESGLKLVVSRHFALSGRLIVSDGIDPRLLRIDLVRSGTQAPESPDRTRAEIRADGVFTTAERGPDVYDLSVQIHGFELSRMSGVTIDRDTDVGAIDLRGLLHACEIEMITREEATNVSGQATWAPAGTDRQVTARIDGARLQILTPTVPIDVVLYPSGYRGVELLLGAGRHDVVLDPALLVRLRLTTDGECPTPPHFMRCDLRRGNVLVATPRGMPYFTPENREIALLVSTPGTVRVHWNLVRQVGTGRSSSKDVLRQHEVELEILDVPVEQEFSLELSGTALDGLTAHPPR